MTSGMLATLNVMHKCPEKFFHKNSFTLQFLLSVNCYLFLLTCIKAGGIISHPPDIKQKIFLVLSKVSGFALDYAMFAFLSNTDCLFLHRLK